MKGQPAFVVGLVDAGSVLHQEGHHVNVVIYACLGREEGRGNVRRAGGLDWTGLPRDARTHARARAILGVIAAERALLRS